jgi:hypothetical protein
MWEWNFGRRRGMWLWERTGNDHWCFRFKEIKVILIRSFLFLIVFIHSNRNARRTTNVVSQLDVNSEKEVSAVILAMVAVKTVWWEPYSIRCHDCSRLLIEKGLDMGSKRFQGVNSRKIIRNNSKSLKLRTKIVDLHNYNNYTHIIIFIVLPYYYAVQTTVWVVSCFSRSLWRSRILYRGFWRGM